MKKEFSLSDVTPDRVAKTKVDVEFFGLMMRKLADQHGDDLGPADPYLAAFLTYVEIEGIEPGQGEDHPTFELEDHLRISSAVNRFFAMVELEKAGHLNHWIKAQEDHVLLHPALIEAACKAQLLVDGERFYFQPIELLNHALSAANANEPF